MFYGCSHEATVGVKGLITDQQQKANGKF